ncbi:filamentous hemagglutinin N-terminal domain-containing protein [Caballeronia sp. GAWG1-1]|uniref:two-partner secretion domain-containing protein n=1 Tax=Caballeronia sp. GAWG1-1 TaxID=2921742 RepID=UPI002028D87F|nr:filamentous hemagglutinin N-terminal domain-containing protein [Caballeronia sp. GAWG1-1]
MRPPKQRPMRCPRSSHSLLLFLGAALAGWSFAPSTFAAGVLPQGGRYVDGSGTIVNKGNSLVVTQVGSTRGVIDWGSFSIGKSDTVTFSNGTGATLNRVTGGSPSALLGNLNATGSLYLINPQGIVVRPSGVVSTGGRFVASTLDVCNDAFMTGGNMLELSGKSDASVVNLGKISSSGGNVFLLARRAVINAGSVDAPSGTVELAAGESIWLQDSTGSKQVFVQTGNDGTVVNKGRIEAAQISLQAADGNVYALAGKGTRIRAAGTTNRNGRVWLVADGGRVEQFGKIAARTADGSGGTVDTQAAQLAFGNNAAVHAGQWNISTPAFTIDGAAARTLQRSLNRGTSVEVTTTGANGATGNLGVASSLRWRGPASLTLAAYHNVSVTTGTTIANNGAGNLTLRADASSLDNGGSVFNSGTLDWSRSTGIVSVLYDMTGKSGEGNIVANNAWTAPQDRGLVSQITSYRLVNSLNDLEQISQDLAGNYALGKDIDIIPAPGKVYTPIGAYPNYFTGQFDGMGHKISNLTIPASSTASGFELGLFSEIGYGAVVRNLNVQGNVASTGVIDGVEAGILAAFSYGTIAAVHTSGTVVGPVPTYFGDFVAGGLVGESWGGTITRSSSSADVKGPAGSYIGGLVGINVEGLIRQSFASGNVELTQGSQFPYGAVGGLVGDNTGSTTTTATITQSYATGNVRSPLNAVGALAGENSLGTIEQSFATGRLQVPGVGGGIATTSGGPSLIASDVFWNTATTGTTVAVLFADYGAQIGAQGLTTAQMSMPSSFGRTYDFRPKGVWIIPPGGTHPVLRWQLSRDTR